MAAPEQPYIPVEVTLERDDERSARPHAPWKMAFKKQYGEKSASTNVEWLTQGEVISAWQAIGRRFNLAGMGDAVNATPDEPTAVQAGDRFTYGRGHGSSGCAEVLDIAQPTGKHTYHVVLMVAEDWQARAIAAILNGK